MALEMIGLEFHEAGEKIIPCKIEAALGSGALSDFDNAAIIDRDPAPLDAIGHHDLGVFEDMGDRSVWHGILFFELRPRL